MWIWFLSVVAFLSSCALCAGQNESLKRETIIMRAVLFSNCLQPSQKIGAEDVWPVQVVDVSVEKTGKRVLGQFQESDELCKKIISKSFEWTPAHFDSAKARLKRAGLHDGAFVTWAESSGNALPISHLKVQSPDLNGEIYTMYLRFRWSGKMDSDGVLDEWHFLLRETAQQIGFRLEGSN